MNRFFNQWGPTELALEGNYITGTGKIKTLNLKTGNSQVHAEGMIHDVLDLIKSPGEDTVINASISSEFKGILTPFLHNVNVPSDVKLQLKSSGNPKKIFADAKVLTKWGNVNATGRVTRQVNNIDIDMNLIGEKVDLGEWLSQSWIGPDGSVVGSKRNYWRRSEYRNQRTDQQHRNAGAIHARHYFSKRYGKGQFIHSYFHRRPKLSLRDHF